MALGLCALHAEEDIPFSTLKRGLNFLRGKMIACLLDCLRPRGWGEVVWEDRELKVGGKKERALIRRKTGRMTLKIKDSSVCELCKWRAIHSNCSGPTGELYTFICRPANESIT